MWIQSLPKAFTRDQHRESNPGPLDPRSDALDHSATCYHKQEREERDRGTRERERERERAKKENRAKKK